MIKNIIFDMGNVLLNYDPEIPLNAFVKEEEGKNIIRRELFEGEEWIQRDLGLISREEQFSRISRRIPGYLHGPLKRCVYEWDICMTPVPGAKEFCACVKEKGYGIYVLSNASTDFYEYFPGFQPLDYFDGIVVSADLHIIKPDLKIYKYLLEKYHLRAGECLFIDDRQENVDAAKNIGMHGVVFRDNYGDIRKMIEKDYGF